MLEKLREEMVLSSSFSRGQRVLKAGCGLQNAGAIWGWHSWGKQATIAHLRVTVCWEHSRLTPLLVADLAFCYLLSARNWTFHASSLDALVLFGLLNSLRIWIWWWAVWNAVLYHIYKLHFISPCCLVGFLEGLQVNLKPSSSHAKVLGGVERIDRSPPAGSGSVLIKYHLIPGG